MSKSLLLSALLLCAAPAFAEDVYECSFEPLQRHYGWIAETVIFAKSPEGDEVTVSDGVIMGYVGKPVVGEVVTDNNIRLSFRWNFKVKDSRNQTWTARYRMTYVKATKKAEISITASGYVEGGSRAEGTCRKTKG